MKKYLLTIITMMLFSSFAVAGNAHESEKRFMKLDDDKNGGISLSEAKGRHRVGYYHDVADTNNDGHVDKAEFSAFEIKDAPK